MFGHFHLFDGSLDYWEPNLGRGTQTLDANGWLSMNELDHTLVWVGNIMNPVFYKSTSVVSQVFVGFLSTLTLGRRFKI